MLYSFIWFLFCSEGVKSVFVHVSFCLAFFKPSLPDEIFAHKTFFCCENRTDLLKVRTVYPCQVPRGVIDLEAYTDIGVEESTGAIVLGPGPDAPPGFRKFYFRPEDNTVHRGSKDSRFLSRSRAVNSSGSSSSEGPGCEASMREDDVELHAGEEDGVWEGIGDGGGGGRLGEWLSGLHRERFKVVRDERDAYMNLQVLTICVS